jgi:3-deoxy-D-manno-octulosonate 8-phosphate phosphatase (KDO 8-P phosphatase)
MKKTSQSAPRRGATDRRRTQDVPPAAAAAVESWSPPAPAEVEQSPALGEPAAVAAQLSPGSEPTQPPQELTAHEPVVLEPALEAALAPSGTRRKTPRRAKAAAVQLVDDMLELPSAPPPQAGPALLPPLTPALAVVPQLLLQAQGVQVAFFDVDGVLTDGGLFFSEAGETLKRFNTLDGHGIKLLAKAGITPAVVTGRDAPALRLRLAALGIRHVRYGTEDKRPAAESILQELGLQWSQAAWIGDDWPDLPAMRRCQFACAPANAHAEVKAVADHVTQCVGGQGAAREFCDLLLVASGRYVELLQEYAA